ncbi:MAG TPA: UDP-3-O-(3-hydroxymyristoyl)glucosamine N-acyltransferase [Xanthobacteraceae bacterium]|jgi:UDP-3-O-[3-hydroxymyristoyl] glucosamine N-acyltransferase|nr:UDP-3-O-(3-hydroxymyristoyl)glucosamine N-acyltransferase [Xanthobacteraceae bacterium]
MTSTGSANSLTLAEIALLTGAVPRDGVTLSHQITGIAPIDHAGPGDLTFIDNPKFAAALEVTKAGAVLTTERFEGHVPASVNLLRTRKPYRAFVIVAREFYRDRLRPTSAYEADGVMPGAHVHPSAELAAGVTVDPGAVIGPRVVIGAGASIGANTVIGADVRIGCDCAIGPNCTVIHSELGNRVILHPGCRIGQDGFGYVSSPEGHAKVPQVGRVVIHDDVEIGAGTTVDRGGMRDTVIGEGTKIDNLVQIGHNVVIGRHCIIVAQSGLSGSVTLKDFAVLAARVGIYPHVTVHEGAQISARATVRRDVPAGEKWGGLLNAKPLRQSMREMIAIERLAQTGMAVASSSISGTTSEGATAPGATSDAKATQE